MEGCRGWCGRCEPATACGRPVLPLPSNAVRWWSEFWHTCCVVCLCCRGAPRAPRRRAAWSRWPSACRVGGCGTLEHGCNMACLPRRKGMVRCRTSFLSVSSISSLFLLSCPACRAAGPGGGPGPRLRGRGGEEADRGPAERPGAAAGERQVRGSTASCQLPVGGAGPSEPEASGFSACGSLHLAAGSGSLHTCRHCLTSPDLAA